MLLRRVVRTLLSTRWSSSETNIPSPVKDNDQKDVQKEETKSTAVQCVKECELVPKNKDIPLYAPLKSVNVAILGANNPISIPMMLMLKLNCLINELRYYDEHDDLLKGMSVDIGQISTRTKAISYKGQHQLRLALNKANIVVITAPGEPDEHANSAEVFKENAEYVKNLAQSCIAYCPEAVVIVAAYPITATVPLVVELFLQNGVLCPNRIMGSMALEEMRTRTLTSISLGLDPQSVQVDLIGGATPKTAVPVLSGAKPGGQYIKNEFDKIHKKLARMSIDVFETKTVPPFLTEGFALSQLVGNVVNGLCNRKHRRTSVFLRTSALFGVKYLAVPCKFGLSGVEENYGVPLLSINEIEALDNALVELRSDIALGEEYAKPKNMAKKEFEDFEIEEDVCQAVFDSCNRV